ncbi:MAG TPA: glutamine--tRNA ligase/YqeY domain fusion protein [Myxococcales bacterium]|nr:glutamine--tRNA ligase/YqeY domain fusion protein [Myxococcales bacterium]
MAENRPSDFIREMVTADVARHKHGGIVRTRFPPEPNGYLHIGHAKSICLNFGIANEFNGVCHLRMDDTNPETEEMEYVEAIQRDVRWLGFDWRDKMFYASDYYERLYEIAEKLIGLGRAYVCDCSEERMGQLRGTVTEPGKPCEHRSRSAQENLELFRLMRDGEFKEGARTLRGKIDMASPNMKMRDPPLYRIKFAHHYRRGDKWVIYPLYDYAHCLSDSMEGITHSLCTTEFESARELYDWVLRAAEMPWLSEQTEFARLNLSYTVMSKRKLLELVEKGDVKGWDDPRLPTLAGLRRRGCTPEAIREFCAKIGVSKNLSVVDIALFEHTLRDDLEKRSPRVMGVLRPLKLTITDLPENHLEELDAPYWPPDANRTETRKVPFTREVLIERDDFSDHPPKDWKRLAPGRSVRLRHAAVVTCNEVVRDGGEVIELRCTHAPQASKADGTIHWVSAARSLAAEVRLYDRLFNKEMPGEDGDFRKDLNPNSLNVVQARVEPSLANAAPGDRFQFERQGYFVVDQDSKPGALVFGRTVSLKDTWAVKPKAAEPRKPKAPQKAPPPPPSPRTLSPELQQLVLAAIDAGAPEKEATDLVANDLVGEMRARKLEQPKITGAQLAELLRLVAGGTVTSRVAKEVLGEVLASGASPRAIVEQRGLSAISDSSALQAVAQKVVQANPELAGRYRAGNANVIGALLGIAMRESGGRANPQALRASIEAALRA